MREVHREFVPLVVTTLAQLKMCSLTQQEAKNAPTIVTCTSFISIHQCCILFNFSVIHFLYLRDFLLA